MTYEQCNKIREDYLYMIGMQADDEEEAITDILIVPKDKSLMGNFWALHYEHGNKSAINSLGVSELKVVVVREQYSGKGFLFMHDFESVAKNLGVDFNMETYLN